jgi:hypothetical protein
MEEKAPVKPSQPARTPTGRTALALAGTSFIFELATVIALLLGHCSLATILAVLAALFGGGTVYYTMSASSGDKPDPFGYDPPPSN